jgi:mRNA interferase YafQ
MEQRGKDMRKLRHIVRVLISGVAIPAEYCDHPFKGAWKHYRDLHVEPDWLLICRIDGNEPNLARTGTHSHLFNE